MFIAAAVSTGESGSSQCDSAGTGNGTDDDSDGTIDDGCPAVAYGYDAANNRTSVAYPDAKVATYTYDSLNRMSTISGSSGWFSSSVELPPEFIHSL